MLRCNGENNDLPCDPHCRAAAETIGPGFAGERVLLRWPTTMAGVRRLTFEVRGRRRCDARPRPQTMYNVPVAGAWWRAVGGPFGRRVRPRSSRSGGNCECLRRRHGAGGRRRHGEHRTTSGMCRCCWGGKRHECGPREDGIGADLNDASHLVLSLNARPNVRGKGATTA